MLPMSEKDQDAGLQPPNLTQGQKEPCMGISHPNMAAGQLLIGEPYSTSLCQAIVILGGGAPFYLLKVSVLGTQA